MENLVYFNQPYLREIKATVVDVKPLNEHQAKALMASYGKVPEKVCAVVLNQTIFYPEGGGQPGDRGSLSVSGVQYRILDTQKLHNNVVHAGEEQRKPDLEDTQMGLGIVPVHLVGCEEAEVVIGTEVLIELDWEHRYFYMCEHTAQHLLSGLMFNLYKIGTVAVHLGSDDLTIEVASSQVSEELMLNVEAAANDAVLAALPVTSSFLSHEDAEKLSLRRSIKVNTAVRIVNIGDLDSIACGGIHVGKTSECRMVLYQGQEKIRGNVRTVWKTGISAMDRIHQEHKITEELCGINSAKPEELGMINRSLIKNLNDERYAKGKLATLLASSIVKRKLGEGAVCAFVIDEDVNSCLDLKNFGEASLTYSDLALAVIKKQEDKLLWLIVLKGKYEQIPFATLRNELLSPLAAKGGGRAPMYQGMAPMAEEKKISDFLEHFIQMIS